MKNPLRFMGIYYIAAALVLAGLVNPRQAYLRRLQYLSFEERYLVEEWQKAPAINARRLRNAAVYYKLMTKVFPRMGRAYGLVGVCYDLLGETALARRWYHQALRRRPDLFWVDYNLGLQALKEGDGPTARHHFERVLRRSPQQWQPHAILHPLKRLPSAQRQALYRAAGLFTDRVWRDSRRWQKILANEQPSAVPESFRRALKPVLHPWIFIIPAGKEMLIK